MKIKLCYFNQHWNIYMYSNGISYNDWLKDEELTTVVTNEGEYRLRKYNHPEIPVYSFGYMVNDEKHRPGHGGEWSSNSVYINSIFGTNLLEIAVDGISVAAPIDWLKQLMGNKVTWIEDKIYGYKIISICGEENVNNKWVELSI